MTNDDRVRYFCPDDICRTSPGFEPAALEAWSELFNIVLPSRLYCLEICSLTSPNYLLVTILFAWTRSAVQPDRPPPHTPPSCAKGKGYILLHLSLPPKLLLIPLDYHYCSRRVRERVGVREALIVPVPSPTSTPLPQPPPTLPRPHHVSPASRCCYLVCRAAISIVC